MPKSKLRKNRKLKKVDPKTGIPPYKFEPSNDNTYAQLLSAKNGREFQKEMLKTNFDIRDRENRRERAKVLSKGEADPFVEEQEYFGSKYKVGDKVTNNLEGFRKIVEVQSHNGVISYAWVGEKEAGVCTEKTMIKFSEK